MALYHFSVKQVPEEKVRQWLIPQLIFRGRSFITIIMDRHMTIQKVWSSFHRNSDAGICAGTSV